MKSLQTSEGKKFLSLGLVASLAITLALGLILSSCAINTHHDQEPSKAGEAATASGKAGESEVTLTGDRRSVEDLRKSIPTEKRHANDDLKAVLAFFGEVKEPPQKIRDRYQRIIQREREKFRRDSEREREAFNREEKKRRDDFNAKNKAEREDFNPKRSSSDEKKRFFDELEQKRRDFNNDERTKRDDFNGATKQKSDDFNAEMRDRDQEFNEQYRAYSVRYSDWQKELKEKSNGNSLFKNSPTSGHGQNNGQGDDQ